MKSFIIFTAGILMCLLILATFNLQDVLKVQKPLERPSENVTTNDSQTDISGLTQITLNNNKLVATEKSGEIFGDGIALNGRTILTQDHTGLHSAYPSKDNPELVLAWSDCGGSSCGRESTTLIDLKASPPFHITLDELAAMTAEIKKVSADIYMIKGRANYLKNSLGDELNLEILYNRKDASVEYQSEYAALYAGTINQHPEVFFSDESARQILLNTLTKEQFADLRDAMQLSDTVMKADNGRTILASGMTPHGGDPRGFFIIDILKNEFIAGYYEGGNYTLYSNVQKRQLSHIMRTHINGFIPDGRITLDGDDFKVLPKK